MGRLYAYPFDYLAWGFPALAPTGFWVGTSLGEKMAAFQRARANENSPELPLPVSLSPQWATAFTPTSTVDPPTLAGKSGPVDYEVLAFFLGPGAYETLCVPSNNGILFPPVLWNSCYQTPLALKARFSSDDSSPLPNSQAGVPDMELRTFNPTELLWYNYFPAYGSPTQHVWDLVLSRLYLPPTVSS